MALKDSLARLEKSVAELAGGKTPEQFIAYAAEQIEKAKTDKPEVRVQRLKHLAEQIKVAKEFEGVTPTPSMISVSEFTDPDQLKPTPPATQTPQTQGDGVTNFSTNPVPPAVAGAGSPLPGGQVPPLAAGGSGFETPGAATFAKSMKDLGEKVEGLIKSLEKPAQAPAAAAPVTPAAPAAPAVTTTPETPAAAPAVVTKNQDDKDKDRVMWPLDMATPFGMGKVEKAEEPAWGWDGQKPKDEQPAAPAAK